MLALVVAVAVLPFYAGWWLLFADVAVGHQVDGIVLSFDDIFEGQTKEN